MTAIHTSAERVGPRRTAAVAVVRVRWMAAVAALVLLSACASTPSDSQVAIKSKNGDGLGGTGIKVAIKSKNGDGLGGTGIKVADGTGVVGTISGFGSIIVNGLKLEFDHTTNVATDGRPTSLDALRIGQVVQGVARQKDGRLTLEALDIQHAVSGPIGAIDHAAQTMTVLGQNVRLNLAGDETATKSFATLHVGDQVSVSGLRLSDGTVIASRVDQHDDDHMIVRGETASVAGDRLRIGGLEVPLAADATVTKPTQGGRVFVSGRMIGGRFVPDVITGGTGLPFAGDVGDVSLEGYAPKAGAPLNVQGAPVVGSLPAGVAADDRIVVTGQIAPNGSITAASIAKVRTVVTIMKAEGSQRPAAMRPDTARPERVAPRPAIERPQITRPPEAPPRPVIPERPQIERPGGFTGV